MSNKPHTPPPQDGSAPSAAPAPHKRHWVRWVPAALISLALSATIVGGAIAFYFPWPAYIGPAQPIAFSHRVHANDKKISCIFCHPGVTYGARATIPSVAKCMLCHQKIITTHPEIIKVRRAFETNEPIEWVRINDVPPFVFFTHERHILSGVDCGRCHGDVTHMDRVALVSELHMGFCIQCHRDNNASTDCWACHR